MFNKFDRSLLATDLPAAVVVFLVALPLCLGIALASGAPMFSGLVAGIIGGIVVGFLSGSHVSVSGPAAGLTVIVLNAIDSLGSFEIFLGAVVVAGLIQLLLGSLRAGVIGYYFPTAVIRGMLAAIGLILIFKQIPYAVGYVASPEGAQIAAPEGMLSMLEYITPASVVICAISLAIILWFETPKVRKHAWLGKVPGALAAVLAGIILNQIFSLVSSEFAVQGEQLVQIPITEGIHDLGSLLVFPDFSLWASSDFWLVAVTLAIVASIETLLSIEAADKLDPERRITPASRELVAQGAANTLSGFVGGLPITAVIVRSSANITAGARSKLSAILHGVLLLVLVLAIPGLLNMIPFATLAAVLFQVGYKLTRPVIFQSMYAKGMDQFLPFVITIAAILVFDLLVGISIGMVVGFYFVIKTNFHSAITFTEHRGNYLIKLQKDVSFLNKAILLDQLSRIPGGSHVLINGQKAQFIDEDIRDVLVDFKENAHSKDIHLSFEGFNDPQEVFA